MFPYSGMSWSIPFIRAAAMVPLVRWLGEQGRNPAPFLDHADLAWVPLDAPLFPMPLRSGIRLIVEIARAEGPDAPYRIVSNRGGFEIGLIGAAAFSGITLRDGLHRMARAMPLHCTHELLNVTEGAGAVHVRDAWATNLGDAEARHLVQQYVAALIDMICRTIVAPRPCTSRIAMIPHPQAGLQHLRPWLGDRLIESGDGLLEIDLPAGVSEIAVPASLRETAGRNIVRPQPLRTGKTLSDDVVTLVGAMLPLTRPSLERVAAAAGLTERTLRRRLSEEGNHLSGLIEQARATIAVRRLREDPSLKLSGLAGELGYTNQSTLSRAVRRWTGRTPQHFRKSART